MRKTAVFIDPDGKRCILDSFVDITERNRTLHELTVAKETAQQESLKLRAMIEGMEKGIVVADATDRITEVNGWFLRLMNLRKEEVVGRTLWSLHPNSEAIRKEWVKLMGGTDRWE